MNRADACAYDDKQQKSRTRLLQEQLSQLERRLRDLESGSDSSSGASSPLSSNVELDLGLTPPSDGSNPRLSLYTFASRHASPSPASSESSSVTPSMLFTAEPLFKTGECTSRSSSASPLGGSSHTDPRMTLPFHARQYL
ncbi:hypothetical protein C0993_010437 [Termitomyces sp. T159_Od127]|nr:hypothetical protein C0993_010437 [Termitomyces sp. T159_Od127]